MRLSICAIIIGLGACSASWAQTHTPAGPTRASRFTADELRALHEALVTLTNARQQLAGMVSDCDGGDIAVLACPPPRPGPQHGGSAGCVLPLDDCDVVAALKQTEVAIDHVNKALAK